MRVVGAAFATATWTRSRRLALASGAALAFLPQLAFVNAYVNADSFTIAAVTALVAALSAWTRAGEKSSHLVLVGAAIGLVVLGKPTGYPALVPTVVWLLAAWRRRRLAPAALGRATMAALLVAGPVLIANALRNAGDPFGLGKYRQLIATAYDGRPIAGLDALPSFLGKLARSSFGMCRHADLQLPFGFYLGAAAALGLGLAAGTVALRASPRRLGTGDVGRARLAAASVGLSVGLVV
jgi:4-amino-4-deoxy-L-arabinose transferase-like glycosyltransferase